MELRLGLYFERDVAGAGAPDGPVAAHERMLESATRAEALGFDSLWVGERPQPGASATSSALLVLAALAVRTARVRIGSGVLPLALHHPLRVAEDAATIDVLSGGRLELGVGLGDDPRALAAFGVPTAARAERLEEAITLLRAALSGAPIAFHGRHFEVTGPPLAPHPLQPEGPPLWIGAQREPALRRVARLGAGLMADDARAAQRFLRAWRTQGRAPELARIALRVPLLVSKARCDAPAGLAVLEPAAAVERLRATLAPLAAAGRVELLLPLPPLAPARTVERALELLAVEVRGALLPPA